MESVRSPVEVLVVDHMEKRQWKTNTSHMAA
jgi:hypothetical protein